MSSFWTPSGEHEVPNGTDESSSTATSDNFTEEAEIDPAAAAAMEQQLLAGCYGTAVIDWLLWNSSFGLAVIEH